MGRQVNKYGMKFLQIFGNLSPFFIALLAYSLFGAIEPELPSYITALLIVFSGLGIASFFIFTIPSSVILLKADNRNYFCFNSKFWLLVLTINWLYIGLIGLCILVFIITS